ncbi:MAG: glutaredoxin [Thermoleophilia bacterium]|nr:glutaredoxin [Thermoleophilia bacterium]
MARVHIYTSDACGFCSRTKALLNSKDIQYTETHIGLTDIDARRALAELTGRFTVPQILIDDQPIGGWDELSALERQGRLDHLLGSA